MVKTPFKLSQDIQTDLHETDRAPTALKTAFCILPDTQTGMSNLDIPRTRFMYVKADSDFLQASYTLYGSQNGVSELLQASYTLYGGQSGLSELV